jgi:hypothetical protein
MKNFFFPFIFLVLLTGQAFSPGTDWVPFTSKDAKVSVKFPANFQENKQQTSNGTVISARTIRNDDIFYFSATISIIPLPNPDYTARLVLENNIRKHNATIIKQNDFAYKKYKGREAVYKDIDGTYYYRSIAIGSIVYQMMVFTIKKDIKADINTFFSSFECNEEITPKSDK